MSSKITETPGGLLGGIHALFHGSDLGCAYGGMSCPARIRTQQLLAKAEADTRTSSTPESALAAARKIVDYITLSDEAEPDDSTGSPTEYIAAIITHHLLAQKPTD